MASMEEIKSLREQTGAGINAIREALAESQGDHEAALKYLRQKGMAKADKRKGNATENGVLGVYVHANNRVVTVVEVACETDFAAKGEEMLQFANAMALQVAAANPEFISVDSVTDAKKSELKDTFEQDLAGKPEEIKDKIMEGKYEKYYKDAVLMEQELFTDDSKTVKDVVNELVAKIGEKIVIQKFYKFEVSQDVKYCSIKNEEVTSEDE